MTSTIQYKKCGSCKTVKPITDYIKNNTDKQYKTCKCCRDYQKQYRLKKKQEHKKVVHKKQTYELKYIIKKQLICKEIIKSYEKKRSTNNIEEKRSTILEEMPRDKKIIKFVKKWSSPRGIEEVKDKYSFELKVKNKAYKFENKCHSDITKQFNLYNKTALSSFVNLLIVEINDNKFRINDVKKLMKNNMVQNMLYALSNNHGTIRTKATRINNAIRKRFGDVDKKMLVFLRLQDAIDLNAKAEEKAQKANEETITLKIKNILEIVNHIKTSNIWDDKVIYAGISTGARLIEILNPNVSQFTEESKNMIKQEGVAKDKSGNVTTPVKPVMFSTAQNIIRIINEIRNEIKDELGNSNEKLTEKYNKSLNKRLRVLTKNILNFPENRKIHFHDLRRIYINVSYDLYGKDNTTQSYMDFSKKNLGHHSYGSIKNYSSLKIKYDKEKKEEKKEEKKQEIKSGYDDMLNSEWKNTNQRGTRAKQKRIERIARLVKELERRNIKVTNKLIGQFGYGANSRMLYKKSLMKS